MDPDRDRRDRVAVLLLSLLAPDLVSGFEQEHLPVAAFTTWF